MARGIRRTTPIIDEFFGTEKIKVTLDNLSDKNITLASDLSTTTYGLKDEIKELEKKVAELSLRVPKPRRRIKSIKIRF